MSIQLTTDFAYRFDGPITSAGFKQQSQDFIVQEVLGYAPTGEGEHIYAWVRKQDLNTAYLAEQLAKFCQVPLRNVTYAGRKDKFAVTEQWFGIHLPGNIEPQWESFSHEGVTILNTLRHNKKLRTGNLAGNRFTITLRDIEPSDALEQRLRDIEQHGVPNYYAEQRFGVRQDAHGKLHTGGNLEMAMRMLAGETIRNRNKRSMAISALRSWLFNHIVSERLTANQFNTILNGDALKLAGSNSFFIADSDDEALATRLSSGDVEITAALPGKGELPTKADAATCEHNALDDYQVAVALLADLGLKQERRAMKVVPQNMRWQFENSTLTLSFQLPSGSYATAVLRELVTT